MAGIFLLGAAPPSGLGKSVLNSNFASDWYLNNVKSFNSINWGSNTSSQINADQYPVGTLTSAVAGQMGFDSSYFGRYVLQWVGVGAFSVNSSFGIIVYSGGNGVYGITPSNTGSYQGNPAWINNGSQNCEFAWGALLTSVSSSGGWVKFGVTTNFASSVTPSSSGAAAISSITGNGTTATVTTSVAHGLPSGATVVMDILGNTPSGFNAFGAVCTITGASTFTYSNATNSTTSVAGTWAGYNSNLQFNNITGMPTATTMKVWRSDASSLLVDQSSAYAGGVGVVGGGAGIQSECIIAPSNISCSLPTSLPVYGTVTYSMSDFAIYKKTEAANFALGYQISQGAIDFLTAYKPRFIRYMDALSAQSFYSDFNYKMPITALSYNPYAGVAPKIVVPSLNGTMTGTGDAIQLTNPGYQTGAYVDGEIVQWTCTSSSTTFAPTIQLGTRGTTQVFNSSYTPRYLCFSGTITNGDTLAFTFTASYLPGGARVVNYTINTGANGPGGVPDTSIANLTTNIAALLGTDAVLPAYNFQFGNNGNVQCFIAPSNGAVSISCVVGGAATEVCNIGTQNVATSQVSGRTYTAIYNGTLGGFVIVNASSSSGIQEGGLPAGLPLEVVKELSVRANVGAWFAMPFIYTSASWQALGQWAAQNLGALPVICEYSNEVWNTFAIPTGQIAALGNCIGFPGQAYFYNPIYSYYALQTSQLMPYFVSGYTGAGGSRDNVSIALMSRSDDLSENPSNGCTIDYRLNGMSLTDTLPSFSGSISGTTMTVPSGYNGLIASGMVMTGAGVAADTRVVRQLTNSSTLGPNRGGTYTVTQSQTVGPVTMTPTNPVYAAASGPGGTASVGNYNAFPNRPVDICDTMGYAVYANGGLISNTGSGYFSGVPQANFNNLFTASQNWGSGGTGPDPTAALQFIDDDFNLGINKNGSFNSYCLSGFTNANANPGKIQRWENQIATYDGARPSGKANISVDQYEGNKEQSLTTDHGNTDRVSAISRLTTQFNNNGWTLTAFGASNQDVATNIVDLFLAYHISTQYYDTMLNNWLGAMATIHASRPRFSPAQFGIEGQFATAAIGVPIWSVFSGTLSSQELSNGLAFQYYNNH